jgi:tRNA 2-thiocytidine biosynthesis protein TtcA
MAFLDQELRRLVGKSIHHYDLIADGDRIAVAVSGGKDSLVLLWQLRERLRRAPVHYDLVAVHVDLGFDPQPAAELEDFFRQEGFDYRLRATDFGIRAHGPDNRENPCFWCARLRRAELFRLAQELNCNKIAFGHNQDDFIETFFINICYGGQVSTMMPRQAFFDGAITVIRPLALVAAEKLERMRERLGLPQIVNPCPSAHHNKREELRALLKTLYRNNRKVRGNIFHAMSHVNLDYLPPPLK